MAALSNPKHERFAQHIAEGKSQREAYMLAGYASENEAAVDASASRLLTDAKVEARVTELLEDAAALTGTTIANITKRLLKIAEKGETATEAPMLSVARAALMDAAKLNGLVIDRSELTGKDGAELKPTVIQLVAPSLNDRQAD